MKTVQSVIDEIRKLASEEPDFIYTEQEYASAAIGCSYLGASIDYPNEGKACIVGQALERLGVSREELKKLELSTASDAIMQSGFGATTAKERAGLDWINTMQSGQDNGMSWRNCLLSTDLTYPARAILIREIAGVTEEDAAKFGY